MACSAVLLTTVIFLLFAAQGPEATDQTALQQQLEEQRYVSLHLKVNAMLLSKSYPTKS